MKVVRTFAELNAVLANEQDIGLVPTMGALHAGHRSLMQKCADECSLSIATIFVNPLQFGPNEDFTQYPRQETQDIEIATTAGIHVLWVPDVSELLAEMLTRVEVSGPSEGWEGAVRPGHFSGVATIVLKLFLCTQAKVAYFGLKDIQQCAVIHQMVKDLNIPIQLEFMETVREPSGLALSSRNAYFSPEQRNHAAHFHAILRETAIESCRHSSLDLNQIERMVKKGVEKMNSFGFEVDYLAFVNRYTMKPVVEFDAETRLISAIRYAGVRLIDNVSLNGS